MEKISALELEKFELLKKEEEKITLAKLELSDHRMAQIFLEELITNSIKSLNNSLKEFKDGLKAKYGNDVIDFEGNLIKENNQQKEEA